MPRWLFSIILGLGLTGLCPQWAMAGGKPQVIDHSATRAGNPQNVAWWAVPSEARHDIGYYVGGGAPCRGDARALDEGTWGWDYSGFLLPHRVALNWWHGRRYQGGVGAYRTVGENLESKSTP